MQSPFPSTYSTLSAIALADLIGEKYGWSDTRCRFLTRGVGDTYLIETIDSQYILRIYRSSHRSLSQIRAEAVLLNALIRGGVSVSYPVPDLLGEVIQSLNAIEGQRYGVVFSYALGKSIRIPDEGQLNVFGKEMGKFHNISATIRLEEFDNLQLHSPTTFDRWTFDLDTTLFIPMSRLKPFYKELPEDYLWLEQAVAQVVSRCERVDKTKVSVGYCHFDFLPKNFHFHGDRITFFDFDFMGYGWLVNDLMSFWQYLRLEVFAGRIKKEDADKQFSIFLSAYRKERPVSDEELNVMPFLALGFWLFYMGFHTTHDQFYSFTQPATLKAYTGFLRHLAAKYWVS
jgi:Ser/Thr protein kinase RdoA (MazF antagonist)